DMVLNVGMNSRDYAEVLVDIARSCQRAQGEPAVAMARGCNVEQRVLAILDTQRRRLSLSRRGARALAAAVVGLVLVVGSGQVGLQADPPEADPDASPQAEREATPTKGEGPDTSDVAGIEQAIERGRRNFEAIESGHLRFRSVRNSGPFKPGLT